MNRSARGKPPKSPARGFVFLLIILMLLAIAGTVLLNGIGSSLTGSERQRQQTQTGNDVLTAAKAALIGYAVQSISAGDRLGNFPTPDILSKTGTAISYDGFSDGNAALNTIFKCLSSANAATNGIPGIGPSTGPSRLNQRCLGKFPWREFSLDVGNPDVNDPLGQIPWMAISPNLNVWDSCLATLNSDILNSTFVAGACPAAANAIPYPWMKVVDQNGSTLSDRVVAVLILPGAAIQTGNRIQSRTPASPGAPADYLDMIAVPLGCTTSCVATFDNADLTNNVQTFIQIPPGTRYPANAENAALAGMPLNFNDTLIYITIDELVPNLERRVLSEIKSSVLSFYNNVGNGKYPWMAPFTSPSNISAFNSTAQNTFGLFPFTVIPSGGTAPSVPTDFDWSIPNAVQSPSIKNCIDVGTTTPRYVDGRQFILNLYKAGTALGINSTCAWQTSTSSVTCDSTNLAPSSSTQAFARYTSSSCSTLSGTTSTRVIKPTSITVAIGATCNSTPTIAYAAATASYFSSWSWQCNSVKSSTAFYIDINYSLYTTGGASIAGTSDSVRIKITSAAPPKIGIVNKMRYQPLMPYWFYSNGWYLSAFAAVAPADAPSPVTPCGGVTKLTSGSNTNVAFLALLAGSRLPNPPLIQTQVRPSTQLSDYLEAPNINGGTTCQFSAPNTAVTSILNDQTLVVSP